MLESMNVCMSGALEKMRLETLQSEDRSCMTQLMLVNPHLPAKARQQSQRKTCGYPPRPSAIQRWLGAFKPQSLMEAQSTTANRRESTNVSQRTREPRVCTTPCHHPPIIMQAGPRVFPAQFIL